MPAWFCLHDQKNVVFASRADDSIGVIRYRVSQCRARTKFNATAIENVWKCAAGLRAYNWRGLLQPRLTMHNACISPSRLVLAATSLLLICNSRVITIHMANRFRVCSYTKSLRNDSRLWKKRERVHLSNYVYLLAKESRKHRGCIMY